MSTAADVFDRHHDGVYRFLYRLTGSREDAQDLAQDVFLRVVRALPAYEERRLERAWVFRIARNVWADRRRALRRVPPADSFDDTQVARPERQSLRVTLQQALGALAETDREVFLLREVGGLTYGEIAGIAGGSPDAVRNRIHRARLALRKALDLQQSSQGR
jgi:RNA polymerase sigma-70 factor (ECF subfamily)